MRKQINISNQLNDQLTQFCKSNKVTQSQIIEVALTMYLEGYNAMKNITTTLEELKLGSKTKNIAETK